MRVISLDDFDETESIVNADVCIIGAGAAGLYLAQRLNGSSGKVMVVEAGPGTPVLSNEIGFDCEFPDGDYRGATEGRSFGVGGTTARWGGQMLAFQASDAVRDDSSMQRAWEHIVQVGREHGSAVAKVFGVGGLVGQESRPPASEVAPFRASSLDPVLSCGLPFRKRNFAWMVERSSKTADECEVISNAVVANWIGEEVHGDFRIQELIALSPSGKKLRIRAMNYVLAAGTVETTRILCEINAAGSGRVLPDKAELGLGLSDHLSFDIAEFGDSARRLVAKTLAPRFVNSNMRNWRFVQADIGLSECRYFAHIVFPTEDSGYRVAKELLQSMQARRFPEIGFGEFFRGSVSLSKIAWHRLVLKRLYVEYGAMCRLRIDMEQRPRATNSIRLGDRFDRFGRRIPVVSWSVNGQDEADMLCARKEFLQRWSMLGVNYAAHEVHLDFNSLVKSYDAYHPVGTCRIGEDPAAVVGLDLRVRGTQNLFVLSTAVFPSAGSANPTFSLLCFAEMMAFHLGSAAASSV